MTTGYIYALLDTQDVPFYVGKTINPKQRFRSHIGIAKHGTRKDYVYNKIRKLLREGFTPKISIIEQGVTEEQIDEREQFHIKRLRAAGLKLCNLTDGGEGGKGMTPEMQAKAAAKRRGQKRSEESRKRMSEARMGIIFSEEHRKHLSEARRKRVTTLETRQKTSDSSRGRINIRLFKVTSPDGQEFVTNKGLTDFCREHGLERTLLSKVANGEREHHRGWHAERLGTTGTDH